MKAWPIVEKNGFIAVWHDREGGEPNWELPDIEVWNTAAWGDWIVNRQRMAAHGREVIENIVDVGHFPAVHGGRALRFDNLFTPYSVTQEAQITPDPGTTSIFPVDIPYARSPQTFDSPSNDASRATYHGPSIMYFYMTHRSEQIAWQSWWVNHYTPVNDKEIDLTSAIIVASLDDRPLPAGFRENYAAMAIAAFAQDAEVWKSKIYRADPILCDGDGPIHKLRKWYNRFYLPRAYKLDKNAQLWWSTDGQQWAAVEGGMWADKDGRWLKIGDGKLWWTADGGKNFAEVPEWKWEAPDGNWYKFDAKWTLWVNK